MRSLSDYQGEEAIELWADLLEPMTAILGDSQIAESVQSGKAYMLIAKDILSLHKKEAVEIMLRIDPEPITGLNILLRLAALVKDIGQNEEVKSFFGYAAQTEGESSGSPTENTEGAGN